MSSERGQRPSVSLLMTTMNCAEALKGTLKTVRGQDYPSIEVVIKDGGSTDGTLEVISSFEREIEKDPDGNLSLVWESGPDRGLYDAMNRAVEIAGGDILGVCNDRLTKKNAITLLVDAMEREGTDAVHADLVYMDGDICKRYWHMGEGSVRTGWMPAHPTLYLKRSVYEKYGGYDISMKSSADYDFILRIFKDGELKAAYIPRVLVSMYWGGTSNGGLAGYPRNTWEAYRALRKNRIPFPLIIIAIRIFTTLRQYSQAKKWREGRG